MIALVRESGSPSRRAALGRAALEHADALHRLAHYLARDAADAEDLVQETFARALDAAEALAEPARLRPWLFQILRRLHLDRCRRTARRGREAPPGDGEEPVGEERWLRGDVELEQLRGIVAEELDAALRRLSEDARTVVLLDVEGFTEGEMADVLGCAVGTVKSRLSRARATLRAALADYKR